jgi:two-component system OmpR family response regulator
MRLLLVEDERDLAAALSRALAEESFAVDVARDGDDGLRCALEIDYDAIVLDLMLPRRSGWDVLREIRSAGRTVPVILLTARDAVDDRVHGLNLGADDYLTKPFAVSELVARLRALGRRAASHPGPDLVVGDVRIDLAARRVYRNDEEIELTAREYGILELLARRSGEIVTRTGISEHLYNDDAELVSNAIDVHVSSLRKKLGCDLIQTRRGHGYLILGAPEARPAGQPPPRLRRPAIASAKAGAERGEGTPRATASGGPGGDDVPPV